jgi:hypothetical protein
LRRTDELAAYGLTVLDRVEGKTSFRSEFPSHPLNLLEFECGQEIASRPQASFRCAPSVALPNQFVLASFKQIGNLADPRISMPVLPAPIACSKVAPGT